MLSPLRGCGPHSGPYVYVLGREAAGVDQAEPPSTVQPYVDRLGLTFEIPLDAEQEVAQRYNVLGLPTTFFIDGSGIIRRVWSGEMNSITLAEGIAEISQ